MKKKTKKLIYNIAEILLIVGGLNWGLTIFNVNLVSILFGSGIVANVVYGLVGVSALYLAGYKINKAM